MIAVTDSGPLIALAKLNHLHLLSTLYDDVLIPRAVYHEVVVVGQMRGYPDADVLQVFLDNAGWQTTNVSKIPPALIGDIRLGKGEIEAIALAWEHQTPLLLDEIYARAVAERMGLASIGTLGVLVEAYRGGHLFAGGFAELLATIESRNDIWIHPSLCQRIRNDILGDL
ncbi:MAG: DUF3368 domain-containing protein [Chloroflexi bacterium]|nr:DUF3368 domain-containing protein [Chloroflexota bacterium]MBU1660820.1 DUF3368 domain-containing protein [Chloroflexota bacterium]